MYFQYMAATNLFFFTVMSDCLTDIYYGGSEAEWNDVSNYSFDGALSNKVTVHYNNKG